MHIYQLFITHHFCYNKTYTINIPKIKMSATQLLAAIIFSILPISAYATTSMDRIAEQQTIPCVDELSRLAADTLKENPHRMLAQQEESGAHHLFNAFTVVQYRDRSSHVVFNAVENKQGGCDMSVTESYILQTSCSDARHEAFSKWDFQGKMDDQTFVLENDDNQQAFLTEQFSKLCLVTTRQTFLQ